ncbi:hypothetical protein Ab1vBOLIVR5_gp167c [Agrobacterium phage OLIVR5]|uniref:Uncharacterized protein n=1 Tax=Agrobacterium phage OLIVR5 TaxID=2723773 RepID=A0A858MZ36_9CAUD|nr:hypothetical protein KNU99_gp234 [Agrobacterium phage OLIVR5]QIW87815.1 hypothetical protein Ab1vBOLIVR5_gp167c [Agrobacterium phage OLIVR5]QIW88080.1 hypothetical protein Ab1vBOLIVR6_gp173c [Agrobacterium phage OLIVR6]
MTTKLLTWVVVILMAALVIGGIATKMTLDSKTTEIALLQNEVKGLTISRDLWKNSAEGLFDWIEAQEEVDKNLAIQNAIDQTKVDEILDSFSEFEDQDSSDVLKNTVRKLQEKAQ